MAKSRIHAVLQDMEGEFNKRTRRPSRWRRTFAAATASASSEMSTPSTRAFGNATAQAMAMQPEPVPISRMRLTPAGSIQGAKRCSMSSAMGERGINTRGSTWKDSPANQVSPVRYTAGMRPSMRRWMSVSTRD